MAGIAGTTPAHEVEQGRAHPLGATVSAAGVNFSLFSENATGVELLLFAESDSPQPYQTIRFDPFVNKTFHLWHVQVVGLAAGTHYAYRVDGTADLTGGDRFNLNKVLIEMQFCTSLNRNLIDCIR